MTELSSSWHSSCRDYSERYGAKHEGAGRVSGLLTEGWCKPMGKPIVDATAVGSLRDGG
jgi:hypothetical protein